MILLLFCNCYCYAQNTLNKKDTALLDKPAFSQKILPDSPKKYNPNVAVRRSLILPGWGQYTNKKYWKIPLVYGALGTTAFIFFRNISQYKDARNAYILASDTIPGNDILIKQPYFSVKDQPERIRVFRNAVRQNIDYSVLFFIAFWGLNVADAAVDAHLKTFDVNDDLSLQIKGGYSPMAHTNGVSLVLHIGR
ncbi:MAG: hypothetical protein H7X88_10950 [Gloeobacteraceae cyanobacterium ES-bin-316]|nr:hypothetical protein [Ferruginibacter sp.]